jgi:hypothetical protein
MTGFQKYRYDKFRALRKFLRKWYRSGGHEHWAALVAREVRYLVEFGTPLGEVCGFVASLGYVLDVASLAG